MPTFLKHQSHQSQSTDSISLTDNLFIQSDNLPALLWLKERFLGKVKLIYIDPPYNTGKTSFAYPDKLPNDVWLNTIKERLVIAKELLADDGFIFIQCDDTMQAHLKILMDSLFCFREMIVVRTATPSGIRAIPVKRGEQLFKLKEYILCYSKTPNAKFNKLFIKSNYNHSYRYELTKTENGYIVSDLKKRFNPDELAKYCLKKPNQIYSLERNNRKAGLAVKQAIEESKSTNEVLEYYNSKSSRLLIYNGGVFSALSERLVYENNKAYFGVLAGDLWFDEVFQSNASDGGVQFKAGKKPEKLIKRIIELTTNQGDLVLDFYAGSGTTLAVAHKMNRQYIGIEQMDYQSQLILKRLNQVITGNDPTGITRSVNWSGGGSFVSLTLDN